MRFIVRILVNSLAIYLAAYFIPGVNFGGDWKILLLAGLVLSLINIFIKPILKLISLPLMILSLGLFSFAINMVTVWLLTKFISALSLAGFWAFVWMAILVSLANVIVDWLAKKKPRQST